MKSITEIPPFAVYKALRIQTAWDLPRDVEIKIALENSLMGIYIVDQEVPIAMARIIGDGALNLHIVDVVVAQDRRGEGIGQHIIGQLIANMKLKYPPTVSVTLMAAYRQDGFYKKFGFIPRPNEAFGPGMIARLDHLLL